VCEAAEEVAAARGR